MDFDAVEITVPFNKLDLLSGELFLLGSIGVEDKSEENSAKVIAYFTKIKKNIKDSLSQIVNSLGGEMFVKRVMQEDWANDWKQNFPPFEIVPNINIVPSWINKKPSAKNIVIDPGIAFGTGTHPTTQMCAKAIYDSFKNSEFKIQSFLDLGCGSGILGLISNRLGVKSISSVDIDEDARKTTRDNFKYNNAKTQIFKKMPSRKYDLIVANILLNPLLEMHDMIVNGIKNNGWLILSGFTHEQKDEILQKYNLKLYKSYKSGEWVALSFRK